MSCSKRIRLATTKFNQVQPSLTQIQPSLTSHDVLLNCDQIDFHELVSLKYGSCKCTGLLTSLISTTY